MLYSSEEHGCILLYSDNPREVAMEWEFGGGNFKIAWHPNCGVVTIHCSSEEQKQKRTESQEKDVVCQEGVSRLAVVENLWQENNCNCYFRAIKKKLPTMYQGNVNVPWRQSIIHPKLQLLKIWIHWKEESPSSLSLAFKKSTYSQSTNKQHISNPLLIRITIT